MENLSVIASTEQRGKHAINACHSFMIDPGKEEPKKILTNVSVSIPEVHRKSTGSCLEVYRNWVFIQFSGCNCNLHARKCKFDPKTFDANKKS